MHKELGGDCQNIESMQLQDQLIISPREDLSGESDPIGLLSKDFEQVDLNLPPSDSAPRSEAGGSGGKEGSDHKPSASISTFCRQDMTIRHEQYLAQRVTCVGPWRLLRTIGQGATSKVKLAEHRDTGERRAVKLISRQKFREQYEKSMHRHRGKNPETVEAKERRVLREVSILYLLRHCNILPLIDFHSTPTHYIMFFEHVEGVRMLDFVQCHKSLSERVARKFFRQLLSAVDYLHENGIVHRDLKIENVMVEEGTGTLRLIDFGLSNFYDGQHLLTTYCGSLYFAAPELLHGRPYVGPEVDVWSLGVILYVMAVGQVPFDDPNVSKLHEKIKKGRVEYPSSLSKGLRSLLERILVVDPHRRATLTEVLNSGWVTESGCSPMTYALSPGRLEDPPDERIIEQLCALFGYEFPRRQILSVLHSASTDWYTSKRNPLVLMYLMLCKNKSRSSANRHSISDLRTSSDMRLDSPQVRRSTSLYTPLVPGAKAGPPCRSHEAMLSAQPPSTRISPLSAKEMYPLHAPTLKGLLTATATSYRSTAALRREVVRALETLQMRFDDRLNHFVVAVAAAAKDGSTNDARNGPCKFEVHLVYGMGVHWIQSHRVAGEQSAYKAAISRLHSEMRL